MKNKTLLDAIQNFARTYKIRGFTECTLLTDNQSVLVEWALVDVVIILNTVAENKNNM